MQPWREAQQPTGYEWLVEQGRRCRQAAEAQALEERASAVREAGAPIQQAVETLASADVGTIDHSAPGQRLLPAVPAATATTSAEVAAAASPRSDETPEVPSPGASSSGPPLAVAPAAASAAQTAGASAAAAAPVAAAAASSLPSPAAAGRRKRNRSQTGRTEVRRSKRLREASRIVKAEQPIKR